MNLDKMYFKVFFIIIETRIGGVMVSMHASSEIRVNRIKPKTMQLIFAASLLNTHN